MNFAKVAQQAERPICNREDVRSNRTRGITPRWLAPLALIPILWTPPTQNTDGTPLTDLAGYRIEWGTCNGNAFGSLVGFREAAAGADSAAIVTSGMPEVCIRAFAINKAGVSSEASNVAKTTTPDKLGKPVTLGKPVVLP